MGDLSKFNILIDLDDICVAFKNIDSHFEKLNIVFQTLRQYSVRDYLRFFTQNNIYSLCQYFSIVFKNVKC